MIFSVFARRQVAGLNEYIEQKCITSKVIRYSIRGEDSHNKLYGYFRHFIKIGDGKWLVGIQKYDKENKEALPVMLYHPLEDLLFEIHEEDQKTIT